MQTSRASGLSLFRISLNTSSCYDRIILRIASLAGRSNGQHQALCITHGTFLQLAKYMLKTKVGLSDEEYSHCSLHPILWHRLR
jgi:hypothetical protein